MECYTYRRNVTDLVSDWKTPYERRFGQPFKGPIIPFGSLVEYHPTSSKEQLRIHQFGKKVWLDCSWIFLVRGRNLEKWHNGCRYWVVGNEERIRNLVKRLNAKKVIFPEANGEFIFPIADGRIQPLEEIRTWEHPPWYGSDQGEESPLDFLGESERRVSSSTTSRLTSGGQWSNLWFLVHVKRLHLPPSRWSQSQTLLAERRIIPYSTKCIDVSRTIHTNLDVEQEKRIDDYWTIDGPRALSDY